MHCECLRRPQNSLKDLWEERAEDTGMLAGQGVSSWDDSLRWGNYELHALGLIAKTEGSSP
jgi:hypothetical protein